MLSSLPAFCVEDDEVFHNGHIETSYKCRENILSQLKFLLIIFGGDYFNPRHVTSLITHLNVLSHFLYKRVRDLLYISLLFDLIDTSYDLQLLLLTFSSSSYNIISNFLSVIVVKDNVVFKFP